MDDQHNNSYKNLKLFTKSVFTLCILKKNTKLPRAKKFSRDLKRGWGYAPFISKSH